MTDCPICKNKIYDIHESQKVCEDHLDWHVCWCIDCCRYHFSEHPMKFCKPCRLKIESGSKNHHRGCLGFNKDRRAALRAYGLEGWE